MSIFKHISLALLVILLVVSCRTADTLTEEELLEFDRQGWLYSIQMWDPYLGAGVPDLDVEVSVGGEPLTLTSNGSGIIEFISGFSNEFQVTVVGQGYFTVSRIIPTVDEGFSDRGKTIYKTVELYPEADYGTFTLQGKAEVQSDVTTSQREPAPAAKFEVRFFVDGNNQVIIPIVTDNNGRYKVKVPARPYASPFLVYEAYTTNQTIAINRVTGQPVFPQTLPSIVQIETAFNPTAVSSNSIPFVSPVYATIPAPPAGPNALPARAYSLSTSGFLDGSGGIFLGAFTVTSIGGGYLAGDLPLTVVSLDGGSGAVGVIRDTNADGTLNQIEFTTAGSGYPLLNTSVNKVAGQGFSADLPNNSFLGSPVLSTFTPGAIIVNDIYYGTGSSRSQAVN
ncbi:MAG: hypothetical protein AB7O48_12210 [Cyclobacteriaceae bacterium]